MASLTMASSFLGGGASAGAAGRPSAVRRRLLMVRASAQGAAEPGRGEGAGARGRRAAMLAVAAAAVVPAVAAVAQEGEPKRGTLEAKKKYTPVCVTMPTARICHK